MATTTPEPRLATAEVVQITASATPWTRARSARSTPAESRALPGDEPEVPAKAEEEQGDEQELVAVGRARAAAGPRPRRAPPCRGRSSAASRRVARSSRRPGRGAYIPATCPLITSPTVPRPWLWSVRCSGVMVMIRTIVACPATRAAIAATTAGRHEDLADRSGRRASPSGWIVDSCASANGSGRRRTNDRIAAARLTKRTGTRYGPASWGRPSLGASVARERHEPRADNAADRRAPDNEPDGDRPPARRDEVRGGVARQVGRRVAEADEERAERSAAGRSA